MAGLEGWALLANEPRVSQCVGVCGVVGLEHFLRVDQLHVLHTFHANRSPVHHCLALKDRQTDR